MSTTVQALRHRDQDEDNLALTFDDNRVLALLLGEHDAHLALIEHRLEVAMTPRGNRISIRGDKKQAERARAVLQLWSRWVVDQARDPGRRRRNGHRASR